MGQITIYLDDDALERVRAAAQSQGVSLSKWIAAQVRRGTLGEWPAHVRQLAGAWSDLPPAETLRKPRVQDARRAKI